MPRPDFEQFLKVLRRERPDRPVMYELGFNADLLKAFADPQIPEEWTGQAGVAWLASAMANAGYDHIQLGSSGFTFPQGEREKGSTVSLNEGAVIADRADFDAYEWPDPDDFDYARLERLSLPDGMKAVVWGPGGVLENLIGLVGFDALCFMTVDEPQLVADLCEQIGRRLARYYEICAAYDGVGALMCNDDWGFKTQPMLAPAQMREWIVPWHKLAVEKIHAAGKPALLHSCGNLTDLMDDIIDVCRYDAKHSWEDTITPVEEAYERWGGRIAILGGIDVDFLCRRSPEEITARSRALLDRTAERGGYALGSGNSLPGYVPMEGYLAMRKAAVEQRSD
jgi:uroporphyrinogen decarboxylase